MVARMQALILAGGSGTRFWPLSRRVRPKQLLSMAGETSLLQTTASRLSPVVEPQSIWVCTTERLVDSVRQQLPQVPAEQVLAEPEGRNTAAAIGWSVSRMPAELQTGVVVVLPADHYMGNPEAFRATIQTAADISLEQDRVMTLGVLPNRPEPGYGYLELGDELDPTTGLRQVLRFVEKPDQATAEQFLAGGNYLWNAGIFVFRGQVLLDKVTEHLPELAQGLRALEESPEDLAEIYARLPSISVDHGIMEKLSDLGTLPLDCGWSDLGSWEALWELLDRDSDENATSGSVLAIDSHDSLIFADQGTIAAVGVEGLVVVKTGDAVLVIPKRRSQEVRRIIAELEQRRRNDLL